MKHLNTNVVSGFGAHLQTTTKLWCLWLGSRTSIDHFDAQNTNRKSHAMILCVCVVFCCFFFFVVFFVLFFFLSYIFLVWSIMTLSNLFLSCLSVTFWRVMVAKVQHCKLHARNRHQALSTYCSECSCLAPEWPQNENGTTKKDVLAQKTDWRSTQIDAPESEVFLFRQSTKYWFLLWFIWGQTRTNTRD